MTKEDKELLLKDLSARLPYKTYCLCEWKKIVKEGNTGYFAILDTFLLEQFMLLEEYEDVPIKNVIPYLRRLTKMTEDEKKEFNELMHLVEERCINAYGKGGYTLAFTELNDWLNEHHFDYRNLIDKHLAIEAKEGVYDKF